MRLLALNGNGGSYTVVAATIAARAVQIVEDGSVPGQGLQAQFPGDGFATTDTYPSGTPISSVGPGRDGLAGLPVQNAANGATAFNYRAADVYCKLRSATANTTTVRVVEMEGNAQ